MTNLRCWSLHLWRRQLACLSVICVIAGRLELEKIMQLAVPRVASSCHGLMAGQPQTFNPELCGARSLTHMP
eukprot:5500542-Amphidinium_carterae.1